MDDESITAPVNSSNNNTNNSSSSGTSNANNNTASFNVKLSEQETNELVEWINEISKIGCLCIKYTFLRDLYSKQKPGKLFSKEFLVNEKRWTEQIRKNISRISPDACGLNENNYLHRWFDMDYWRMEYYNYIKQLGIQSADSIWTFDVIHFPYNPATSVLRAPEKDHARRPRNQKPRVSVIFAFNAAGDYLQPYFVYPHTFSEDESSNESSPKGTNECCAPNGFVNCGIFENWLTQCFSPYLREQESKLKPLEGPTEAEAPRNPRKYVLLYCGKLAVVDYKNLKLCQQHDVNLFGISHEKQMPFNLLFKKSLRKRQTDLFLDSWRKITAKRNLSYQIKCQSRQMFFNLFMDAFQNCIEEIGNSNSGGDVKSPVKGLSEPIQSPNQSFSSSCVVEFRNKMASSFEQCELWPIVEETYAQYIENAKLKIEHFKKSSVQEDIIHEEDENNESFNEEYGEQESGDEFEDTVEEDEEGYANNNTNNESLEKSFEVKLVKRKQNKKNLNLLKPNNNVLNKDSPNSKNKASKASAKAKKPAKSINSDYENNSETGTGFFFRLKF